jgi:plasmid stabilization system protein ParE
VSFATSGATSLGRSLLPPRGWPRIVAATDRLETYPRYGRAASWDEAGQLRELAVAGTPFIVLYTVDDAAAAVLIVRVVHGAQRRGPA